MYDDEYSRFSGGTDDRISNMLGRSAAPGLKPYPVTMPRFVKRRYSPKMRLPKLPLPNPSTLIQLGVVGGICLVGYNLYKKFFGNDAIQSAVDNGTQAIGKVYVDTNQSKVDAITATASSLGSKGLQVSQLHKSLADTLHSMLDSMWVDHDKIVKTILGQHVQTFRLVAVAYGTRSLPTYGNSPAHLLNASSWSVSNLFSGTKYTGTLKDHLKEILYDSELQKIHGYISVI